MYVYAHKNIFLKPTICLLHERGLQEAYCMGPLYILK